MRNINSVNSMNTVRPVEGFYYGSFVRFFAGAYYRAHFSKLSECRE